MRARFAGLVAVLAVGVAIVSCTPEESSPAEGLLIEGVTVVSPDLDDPLPEVAVYIRNGTIKEVGHELTPRARRAARTIDGTDLFLVPGLIDGHTHLDEIPGMIPRHEEANPEIARAARDQIPRSYLYHGFTTVVDLNTRPEVIAGWNERPVRPQAHFCGATPVVDGYPTIWLPQPERYRLVPYFLFDADRADTFPSGIDPEDHTPTAVVKRIHQDGGICVKTHFERGFGGRGDMPVPTLELIRVLVAEAHALDLPVLLHANNQEAQDFGVRAGVDVLAHGMWTWDDRTATEPTPDVREVLDAVVEAGIGWHPTIQVLYGERDLFDPDYLARPALGHVVPQSLIDWYSTDDGRWWKERLAGSPFVERLVAEGRWDAIDAEPIARAKSALTYLAQRDARLLFGSDTPSDPTYANPPGLNGRLEMDNWIDAGVTPVQLFRAATIHNAGLFGLDDEIGTVEPGKRADLLLLRRNPLDTVEAYDTIESVILGGEVHARSELSAVARLVE